MAEGWGETPLSVQWAWPSGAAYGIRFEAMVAFCQQLATAWGVFDCYGHAIEVGHAFQRDVLPVLVAEFNRDRPAGVQLPYLAALVCCSAFDIALHDAYGRLNNMDVYDTYNAEFMNCDLADLLAVGGQMSPEFHGQFPDCYLAKERANALPVWHLVGGLDPLDASELSGNEPDDGYPLVLPDWIDRDGLTCLKVKLRGNDAAWDYDRLVRVGRIGQTSGVRWMSADFNCTVTDPMYVCDILDHYQRDEPALFNMLLYVEQPFPYELEKYPIDVRSVSRRKPLFLDESAHDWLHVRRGLELGWNGVALKTCKTQTGAMLSLCWARAHGMQLMVQDLTNPMMAQISHVLLATHANTIMGVESNAMQFYPAASEPEASVHPGLYMRRNGQLDMSTVRGPGFGYRVEEISRPLPQPTVRCGDAE